MRVQRSKRIWRSIKRHRLCIALLGIAFVSATVFNGWYFVTKNNEIQHTTEQQKAFVADMDAKIKAANEKKAAIAKAKQEAAKEAAAKEAAEQAAAATNNTSAVVNSSSCTTSTTHANPASIDVLVNKKHCLQPVSFTPPDLVTSNGATLSAKAIDAYNQLYLAAAAAGQSFYVTSSYRSYSDQIATYNYWVSVSGVSGADTYSARPGYSEHQTGLAFDVAAGSCTLDCFGSTAQYTWLQEHAAEYGFIQRYYAGSEAITGYKAEEWHYRYVGAAVAQDMRNKGVKTLEEYWNLSGGDY